MKRTLIWLLSLCAALMALSLSAAALADTPKIQLGTDLPMDGAVTNYYLGIPLNGEEASGVSFWNNFIRVNILNYGEMAAVCTGDPQWEIRQTKGPAVGFSYAPDVYGNIHRVVASLTQAPSAVMDAEFEVTCTWDGYSADPMTVYFHAIDAPMPQDLETSAVIEGQVGQTEQIDLGALLNGWTLNSQDLYCWGLSLDSSIAEMSWDYSVPGKANVTFKKAGVYNVVISIRADSMILRKSVTLQVSNSGGSTSAALKLQNSFPDRNVYLGMPRYYEGLGPDGEMPYGGMEAVDVYFENFSALQAELGGEPNWTVDVTPPMPHDFWSYAWNDEGHMVVSLTTDMPSQPVNVQVTVTCDWGGKTDTSVATLHYIDLPSCSVPDDHDYPYEMRLSVGDTFEIAPNPLPVGWKISGYDTQPVLFSDQLNAFAEVDRGMLANNRYVYTATTPGTYIVTVMLRADTVYMGHNVIFYVADGQGDVPPPVLELGSWNSPECNYYIGDGLLLVKDGSRPIGQAYSEPFVDRFSIFNHDVWANHLKGDPVWTVAADDPAIDFTWTENQDGRMDIVLNSLPTAKTDARFTVSCDWGDAHGETELTVRFKKVSALPTDLWHNGSSMVSSLTLRTGEALDEIANVSFDRDVPVEDWEDKGFWFNAGDEHAEDDFVSWENGDRVAGLPGEYDITVTWAAANINLTRSCRLIILKADGTLPVSALGVTPWTLPAGLTTIESQAFAGTPIEAIEIPAGVTGIADDAFDGCGPVAIYAHSQYAIDYALAHDLLVFTD